ncbi:MAG TPA: hypothetical protein PK580_03395, partial [Nitrosomonas halophila]|nr:hypothetical protein [Nitrosomonas halophila]
MQNDLLALIRMFDYKGAHRKTSNGPFRASCIPQEIVSKHTQQFVCIGVHSWFPDKAGSHATW